MRASRDGARPWLVALVALFAVSVLANHVEAQDCTSDADCAAGYDCAITGSSGCATSDCRPGSECPPQPPCEPQLFRSCVNAACDSDDDCPDPMLCHAETYEECDDRPSQCRPGDIGCVDPKPAEPTNCTTRTESTCRYQFELPCTADADCGGGFRCIEVVIEWCQGWGGPTADGGYEHHEECGTDHTGEYGCELQQLACSNDAECPSGLTCQDSYIRSPCANGGGIADPARPARDAGAPRSPSAPASNEPPVPATDAGAPTDPARCGDQPTPPAKLCKPAREGSSGSGTGSSDEDDEEPEQPTAPQPNGGVGPSNGGGGAIDPIRRRGSLRGLVESVRESRGCSIAEGSSTASFELSWLALAGVLVSAASRRKRR